jgi:lipid-binding SYLF domain-containing protein
MFHFNVRKTVGVTIAGLLLAFGAAAYAASDQELLDEANATKAVFRKTDPGLATFFERSPGYVIFPSIAKGAVGIGGAHGSGVVYEHGKPIGKSTLNQVSVGAQLGGQAFSEVIFFATREALDTFVKGKTTFSGAVSAVALTSGASANARYQDGVVVFTATRGGLMLEASVGGQKFSFEPFMTVKR